ncbi:MAG: methyltransferase [Methylococcales bacterium]|nr:methyltransferase [Methylococcales bacterium]
MHLKPAKVENLLTVGQRTFRLHRLPKRPVELLQAWDAADEYLLNYLAEDLKPSADARILIFNDTFGALAVALNSFRPQAVSDSYLSQQATRLNLAENGLPESVVKLLNSLDALEGKFDLVLIKAPKTLALLEDELIRLYPYLTPTTQVILAGMTKTLPSSIWKMLERLVGPTKTALARKKARLIFAVPDAQLVLPVSPYPVNYRLEGTEYLISNHANVFSRDNLDIGTRFFLQHLPVGLGASDIIDLGCGNGLLGLMAAKLNPKATVHFVDESFMAVASARENFNRAFGLERNATYRVTDCLVNFEENSADIILCNPPFHQHNTIGDQIAINMLKQSRKVLRKGGELWVIGNRHLGYHTVLDRLFGHHKTVAANTKFIILKARVAL